jgi:WD40 repeat protein
MVLYVLVCLRVNQVWREIDHESRPRRAANKEQYNLGAVIEAVKKVYSEGDQDGKHAIGRDGLPVDQQQQQELLEQDAELEAISEGEEGYGRRGDVVPAEGSGGGIGQYCPCCVGFCLGLTTKCMQFACFRSLYSALGYSGQAAAFIAMASGNMLLPGEKKMHYETFSQFWKASPAKCVLSCRVMHTQLLSPHELLIHPVVRMYVVNIETGEYWLKSDKRRAVMAPMENRPVAMEDEEDVDTINPSTGKASTADQARTGPGGSGRQQRGGGGDQRRGSLDDPQRVNDSFGADDDDQYSRIVPGHNKPVEFILPSMTGPSSLRKIGNFLPRWNEEILINEPMSALYKPETLILYEILDFGRRVDLKVYKDGFFPVAWAFFKPVSRTGMPHHGTVELQLYKHTQNSTFFSNRSRITRPNVPSVWFDYVWQKFTKRVPYPSSLTVNLTAVAPPQERLVQGRRPMGPMDRELGRIQYKHMRNPALMNEMYGSETGGVEGMLGPDGILRDVHGNIVDGGEDGTAAHDEYVRKIEYLARQRSPVDACQIPDRRLHSISCGPKGCHVLAFSPDGSFLAAAVAEKLMFTIKLYASRTGALVFTFAGHHDLIYDLSWSSDSRFLTSASSDNSAKVWEVINPKMLMPVNPNCVSNLQHTCYVYASQFHPCAYEPSLILTGAYDGLIRIWDSLGGSLIAELSNHSTYVNAITFNPNGHQFFTGDADGVIKLWEDSQFAGAKARVESKSAYERQSAYESKHVSSEIWRRRFKCIRTMQHRQLVGDAISSLEYHAKPERLVAYVRSGAIYSFSFLRYDIQKTMIGPKTANRGLKSCISPDGKYVVAGSADGVAYFFDLYTGSQIKQLDVGYTMPMYNTVWHPTEHLVAFCSYGGDYPIEVWQWNRKGEESSEQKDTQRRGQADLNSGLDFGELRTLQYGRDATEENASNLKPLPRRRVFDVQDDMREDLARQRGGSGGSTLGFPRLPSRDRPQRDRY